MREVTFEESRTIQLDILRDIDSACREHGIKYSLSMGTLIGAIRHKGFIPWDDDIDLMMTRDEIEKFISVYDGKYRIIDVETNKDWWDSYTRIVDDKTRCDFKNTPYDVKHGIWVSIIPIDNIPDDDTEWQRMRNKMVSVYRLCKLYAAKWSEERGSIRNCIRLILKFFVKLIPVSFWARKAKKILTSYANVITKRKTRMIFWCKDVAFPSNIFDKYIDIPFEDATVMAIADYDTLLRSLYGDYMKLPPKEEQVPGHDYDVYWLD